MANTSFTFDTNLVVTYTPSPQPDPQGATVDFYIFDQTTGAVMRGTTGEVCNPCSFEMNGAIRERTIMINDVIVARGGGFDQNVKLGFGVLVVSGSDPDGVNLQGFVVNSHTNAFDLSVFGFTPEEIQSPNRPDSLRASEFAAEGQSSALRIDGRLHDGGGQTLTGLNVALFRLGQAGAQTMTVMTDAGGNYSFTDLLPGRDYLVFPLNPTFIFNPGARRLDDLSGNQTADFTATPTIGGRVTDQSGNRIDNVTMVLLKNGVPDRIVPTDERGDYFFRGLSPALTCTVIPSKLNLAFTPRERLITNLQSGLTVANFSGAPPAPAIIAGGASLVNESCSPANGAIDRGERVTVNLKLMNDGAASTSNLVATLQSGSGVIAAIGPQTYGAITPGSMVGRDFAFTADSALTTGQPITATLQLQDGSNSLGSINFNFLAGPLACGGVRLLVTSLLIRTSPTAVQANITVQNAGSETANNLRLTTAKLGVTNGLPMPQDLGSLTQGASANVVVNFDNSIGGASVLSIGGNYTGGSFSSSRRLTVPPP